MPLTPGKENIGKNIKTEMEAGKPRDQAIAIALNTAGESKRGGAGGGNPHPSNTNQMIVSNQNKMGRQAEGLGKDKRMS